MHVPWTRACPWACLYRLCGGASDLPASKDIVNWAECQPTHGDTYQSPCLHTSRVGRQASVCPSWEPPQPPVYTRWTGSNHCQPTWSFATSFPVNVHKMLPL